MFTFPPDSVLLGTKTREEWFKDNQGGWPDGQSELDSVCCGCLEKPTAFCCWKNKIFQYCTICECRLCSTVLQSAIKKLGLTKATVIQIPPNCRRKESLTERGPWYPPPSPEVLALRALPYGEYLLLEHWRKRRLEIIARDGGKCCECGSRLNLQVHHLYYGRLGCELDDDLETLCRKCHEEHHEAMRELREYETGIPVRLQGRYVEGKWVDPLARLSNDASG